MDIPLYDLYQNYFFQYYYNIYIKHYLYKIFFFINLIKII